MTDAVLHTTTDAAVDRIYSGKKVLITGGAGFIGSTLAIELARTCSTAHVIAFDNLQRAGSELNVAKLRAAGVEFCHGDVRVFTDLEPFEHELGLIVDCAANPSVLAGYSTPPSQVIGSNLVGTLNVLELARRSSADVVFLSTSRVYPIAALNRIATDEGTTRFVIAAAQTEIGVTPAGIDERFTLDGVRSLYGATKLASELLLQEYAAMYGLRFVINRLGVVSGRGQMGRVEQGVFSLWMARHYFGGDLTYRGWGGTGKQVRDLMHVQDVWHLVRTQLGRWDRVNGGIYNVGGGPENSVSLCEATDLCREIVGRTIPVHGDAATHTSDVRVYCSDVSRIAADTGWQPSWDPRAIFSDLFAWFREDESILKPIFNG
jgi:CDP-paratose 2-epimerase